MQPNLVLQCTFMPLFYVPTFKAIRVCVFALWTLSHLDKKKNETQPIFNKFIPRKHQANLSLNLECEVVMLAGILKLYGFVKHHRITYVQVKITLLFFLLITSVLASCATRYTTMCIDYYLQN